MRNGKIAKLPASLRDELNLRMENGGDGAALLQWLNSLPEVQETLQADFGGVPVSRQNLHQWRHGGFREWQIREDFTAHACQLSQNARDMEEVVDPPELPADLVLALAARYAALLNTWDGEPDPKFEAKLRPLRALARDISLIESTMRRAHRQKAEYLQQLENETRRAVAEVKQEALAPFWAALRRNRLTRLFAGENKGKKADKAKRLEKAQNIASLITAIMYDLPAPKRPKEKPAPSMPSPSAESEANEQCSGGLRPPPIAPLSAVSEANPEPKAEAEPDPPRSVPSPSAEMEAKAEAEPEPPRQTLSHPVKVETEV